MVRTDDDRFFVGNWIRTRRLREGWNQAQLANKVAADPGQVSRWERHEHNPTIETLRQLCKLFGASADEALQLTDRASRRRRAS